jgi:hypothetical protein
MITTVGPDGNQTDRHWSGALGRILPFDLSSDAIVLAG